MPVSRLGAISQTQEEPPDRSTGDGPIPSTPVFSGTTNMQQMT